LTVQNGSKNPFWACPTSKLYYDIHLPAAGSPQMTAKVSNFRLFLFRKKLKPVKAARDLGVTLDSHLMFNEHIVSIVSSCMS